MKLIIVLSTLIYKGIFLFGVDICFPILYFD